jgi:hypothetical protein
MRGSLIHVFTGLALGLALAGLLHAPTELVAQQEARTPVVRPKGTTAGPWAEEQTVRVSPKVERELDRRRARRLSPRAVPPPRRVAPAATSTLVSATVPETPVGASSESQPAYATDEEKPEQRSKEKPKPAKPPRSEPKPQPVAPPAKVVASNPQPAAEPSADEGKKPKKPKKPKKAKKVKKDKAEKHDEHEETDKSDKKDKDGPRHGEDEQDDDGKHKHGDKD